MTRRSRTVPQPRQVRGQLDAIARVRLEDMADAYASTYEAGYAQGRGEFVHVQSSPGDPTANVAADREALRNKLRGIGNAIEHAADLLAGVQADLDKLAGLDAVGAGRRQLHSYTRSRHRRAVRQ